MRNKNMILRQAMPVIVAAACSVGLLGSAHNADACTSGTICYTDSTAGDTAISGTSTNTSGGGTGVEGESAGGQGVLGILSANACDNNLNGYCGGVVGYGTTAYPGVFGINTGSGPAVTGLSSSGNGVLGETSGSGESGVAGVNSGTGNGVYGKITGSSGNEYAIYGNDLSTTTGTHYAGYFSGDVYTTGCFKAAVGGDIGGTCLSDRRLKKSIEPMKGALDRLMLLKGVTYEWNDPTGRSEPTGAQGGFIAQDVATVFPTWVSDTRDGFKALSIPTREFQALEVEALRTLKTENGEMKAKNDALEARLERLETGGNPSRAGFTFGNGGWGLAGLAFGAFFASKRKKAEQSNP